ncbi:pantetheine-phosphate adenylyltransferase [Lactococcus laudensis]|uniref:Phosphopantetheine adenylyltransferase n=1 Tax=Pseudolactococcus laudensis TaxID=1494461 RepID=A0A7V8N2D6_9LACT|nr:pantetheine-phosphate adenylyltransferase [Lactococcus laudensis]MBA0017316.1 pantetheine-phosphate adenylyltransferase [Lactococcus laudensis]MBW9282109.1 pantetheine-phosphate adenylyltransferase [Lactococcus laudensis]
MKIGLYTGTFDPITNGHLDIIHRAAKLFDKLYVGIFNNDNKNPFFSSIERAEIMRQLLTDSEHIEIIVHESDLTVNVAQKLGVTALVRSVRNAQDLDYESAMIYFNQEMTGVETVLLAASPELQYVSSSRMKELAHFGVDVSKWVPELVALELEKKFEQK